MTAADAPPRDADTPRDVRWRRVLVASVVAVLVLIGLAAAYAASRNPEIRRLDDAARAEASGRFVTLPEGRVHYELSGPDSGRLVVLVHGFSVPMYIWDSTVTALTGAGYRVLRYDTYGRGYSDRPDVAYDGALYDAQLRGLLDSLRVTQPVHLMGVSFGGFITAHFIGAHRDRVHTLTLVDPVTRPRVISARYRWPVIGPTLWQSVAVPRLPAGQTIDFLHPERFPGWAERYATQMRYDGFGRALRRSIEATAGARYDTLYARVGRAGVPALLVWGKQDSTVSIRTSDVVRRNIPGLRFVHIDSAGHLPQLEQPAATHAAILQFLREHP